ncbi:hypothetical protein HAX54_004961 [Datura stramonium]|uniref:Uncharacterized protein n=1 Tax=Datura stramonium TaxID=4076 RepID=A0ABS8T7X2_DATST|nr:hypothetical protein [Datura stramonium]
MKLGNEGFIGSPTEENCVGANHDCLGCERSRVRVGTELRSGFDRCRESNSVLKVGIQSWKSSLKLRVKVNFNIEIGSLDLWSGSGSTSSSKSRVVAISLESVLGAGLELRLPLGLSSWAGT